MNWTKVKSPSLPNLHTCAIDGDDVCGGTYYPGDVAGFIYKLVDTKTDKCAWALYLGIGATCKFIGHSWKKAEAKKIVEKMIRDSR